MCTQRLFVWSCTWHMLCSTSATLLTPLASQISVVADSVQTIPCRHTLQYTLLIIKTCYALLLNLCKVWHAELIMQSPFAHSLLLINNIWLLQSKPCVYSAVMLDPFFCQNFHNPGQKVCSTWSAALLTYWYLTALVCCSDCHAYTFLQWRDWLDWGSWPLAAGGATASADAHQTSRHPKVATQMASAPVPQHGLYDHLCRCCSWLHCSHHCWLQGLYTFQDKELLSRCLLDQNRVPCGCCMSHHVNGSWRWWAENGGLQSDDAADPLGDCSHCFEASTS